MFSWKGKDLSELDSKKLRRNIPAYVILVLAVGAMTFFGVCDPSGNRSMGPAGVVAKVDSTEVSPIEFRRAHINRTQQAQQQYKDNFDPVQLRLSQSVVNGLVDQLVLYKEAVRNGLWASDDEVAAVILDGNYFHGDDNKFDPKLFQTYLRRQRHSESSFTDELRRSLVNGKLRSFITETYRVSNESAKLDKILADTKLDVEFVKIDKSAIKVDVSKEQIEEFLKNGGEAKAQKYFEKNVREFRKEPQVKARHILIAFEGATRASGDAAKRKKADAKKLAEKVLEEAKKGDFVAIAKKYTDEPSGKSKGGDLGFFKKADMVPAFSDKAFSMKKGEISDIVETDFGFHIIKVEDTKAAINKTFADAKEEIVKKLVNQEQGPELAKNRASDVLKAVKAGKESAEFKKLGLAWKSTGEFALNARFLPGGLGADPKVKETAMSLKKVGDVSDLVEVSGSYYILKLKSRKDAKIDSVKYEQLEDLANSSRFMEAFWMYNKLTSDIKKQYEDDKRIYRNADFMQYDAIMRSNSGS